MFHIVFSPYSFLALSPPVFFPRCSRRLIFVSYFWKNTNDLCFISSSLRILSWPCLLLSSFLDVREGSLADLCIIFLEKYQWFMFHIVFSPYSFLALSPPVFFPGCILLSSFLVFLPYSIFHIKGYRPCRRPLIFGESLQGQWIHLYSSGNQEW